MSKGTLTVSRRVFTLSCSLLAFSAGCSRPGVPAVDSREVCAIESTPAGLPRLYRRANAHVRNLGAAKNVCDVPLPSRSLADRCEDVDDLSALLGTGSVCGPDGVGPQEACPKYAAERVRQEPPTITDRPCGQAACKNVQVAVHEVSGTVTRILFYDDPVCHTAPDPACAGAEHRCYYRVLAMTSELR